MKPYLNPPAPKKDLPSDRLCSVLKRFAPLLFLCLCTLSHYSLAIAGTEQAPLPVEYGRVIHQYNVRSPNQLFIIGMSHRSTLTRQNGDHTAKVQAEVYKIGEWLIHREGLELLLPEGFFQKNPPKIEKIQLGAEKKSNCPDLDLQALERMLSPTETFVNAEMLLKKYHLVKVKQVEVESFYHHVNQNLQKLVQNGGDTCDYLSIKSELDYLQARRTAAMLQKIPEIVDGEFYLGNINSKKAIFTIGMSHLPRIIRYLDENRIRIFSPLPANDKSKDYFSDLNLKRDNFGVFIILPKTLLDNPKVLEMNGLDKTKFL